MIPPSIDQDIGTVWTITRLSLALIVLTELLNTIGNSVIQ